MKITNVIYEQTMHCPECGGPAFDNLLLAEKKDACYHKVKATAKVWPSAYASGRLVQCRKKGAANWGNKSEGVEESDTGDTPIDAMTVQELAEYLGVSEQQIAADVEHARDMAREKAQELTEEFDLIESIIDRLAIHNGVDAEAIWEDLESLSNDELYVFAVTTPLMEDWQKANKQDRTDGMSRKAVNAYRRENPGSKLKTAVTTKPSKLKRGSKASKRRSSYCSRSRGQMKMHSISCAKTPDKAICKARRRWNCESIDFNLSEMDKSQTSPGRDGDIDWTKKQIHLGPERMMKAKDVAKHALKALDKSMKKSHADTPKKKGLAEAINPDITNPAFSHQQQIGDYLYVARYWGKGLKISAYHGKKLIGRADLMYHSGWDEPSEHPRTGNPKKFWLESEITEVNPKYQRQGIMSTMYAYARMLGNTIKPSGLQSDEAQAAWKSWRQAGDKEHLTKMQAEGATDDNPVANAIYRRLMNQKPDLFTRYGLEYVAQAVQDVADSVGRLGPDDEIGSSDVSGWVRQVEQNLQDKINQYDEPMSDIDRMEETHRPGHQSSGKNPDDLIGGRYEPDEFDQMVLRLKAMAEKQQRERGPVDLQDLARRLQGIK